MAPTVETSEYAAMLRRMNRGMARRVAEGNPEDLAAAVRLLDEQQALLVEAVAVMRDVHGYSWAQLAAELGVTRQAVQQRFGKPVVSPLLWDGQVTW